MTFQMDASGDESYKSVGGSFVPLPAGRYHAEIVEVDESFQKHSDKVPITFEVIAGTNPGFEGRKHTERFATSEAAMDRLKRLALVVGLLKPGEVKEVSFSQAVGASLVIEMVPHSYKSEKTGNMVETTQLGFGTFWPLDDEEVKDVPRGKGSPQPGGTSNAGGGASATPSGQEGGGSKWDNL